MVSDLLMYLVKLRGEVFGNADFTLQFPDLFSDDKQIARRFFMLPLAIVRSFDDHSPEDCDGSHEGGAEGV